MADSSPPKVEVSEELPAPGSKPGSELPIDSEGVDRSDAEAADSETSAEPAARDGVSWVSEVGPQLSQRRVLAKVYGDDRRLDERRWAVGGSPRRCHACEAEIPAESEFYGTLKPTLIPDDDSRLAEVSALFDRNDYCCACYEGGVAPHAFAYWKGTMDARQREPRKVINLAALLVYFQHLEPKDEPQGESADTGAETAADSTTMPRAPDRSVGGDEFNDDAFGDDDYNDDDYNSGDFEQQQAARERAAIVAALPKIDGSDAQLMRYLLALFLTRKRVLKWIRAHDGVLEMEEAKSKVRHSVEEPRLTSNQLEEAVEAFEELFR